MKHLEFIESLPKWFDRSFNQVIERDSFPELKNQIRCFPQELEKWIQEIDKDFYPLKPLGKWSILEHIGHLGLLEDLWQIRMKELKAKQTRMSPADLTNKATDLAKFSLCEIEDLMERFQHKRKQTLKILDEFEDLDFQFELNHPRLETPMNIFKLVYFVQQHDQHHLNYIGAIGLPEIWAAKNQLHG